MAKKADKTTPVPNEDNDYAEGEQEGSAKDASAVLGDLDFDVESEYKPESLIPKGTYHAVATKVTFDPDKLCIIWDFCLHDNGGSLNDGETPIDGAHLYFRNWLPRPGDEKIPSSNGRTNKRQSKINQLKQFSDELSVDMSTGTTIAEALANQEWLGTEADVEVDITEYEGRFRNEIARVHKSRL